METDVPDTLPPSMLRKLSFNDDQIKVTARYGRFIEGNPNKLYLFAARDIEIHGDTITPPHQYDKANIYSTLEAFYHFDSKTIIYFMENFGQVDQLGYPFVETVYLLHELTHWALPNEVDPDDTSHWKSWNTVLSEVAGYVYGFDPWKKAEIEKPNIWIFKDTEDAQPPAP